MPDGPPATNHVGPDVSPSNEVGRNSRPQNNIFQVVSLLGQNKIAGRAREIMRETPIVFIVTHLQAHAGHELHWLRELPVISKPIHEQSCLG